MKVAVLNGSPKGMTSVTMQYVLFLQKTFPAHELRILNICHDIRTLEDDRDAFVRVIAEVHDCDVVLWATPIYVLLVPGPYKRFIELVFERSAQAAFRGKYAAVLTTSVRFFDHTAHNYLNAISDDLAMHYTGAYSAEMYDLLKEPERHRLRLFFDNLLHAASQQTPTQARFLPLEPGQLQYTPGPVPLSTAAGKRKILVLTDATQHDTNLQHMVGRFCRCIDGSVQVVNLHDLRIKGGCLGCIRCSFDNRCVYRDADDVYQAYAQLMAADIVVQAAAVKDRFLSSLWKTFWDRGFFNNHVPILAGKQLGYLISGPLPQLPGLRDVLEAYADVGQANLAGIVTDQCRDSQELDGLLDDFAIRLIHCADTAYIQPTTFPGKAGRKILRDEIWSGLRCVFPLDHLHYKRHGLYDFPRRGLGTRTKDFLLWLMLRLPSFRKEFQNRMREGMIAPLVKLLKTM